MQKQMGWEEGRHLASALGAMISGRVGLAHRHDNKVSRAGKQGGGQAGQPPAARGSTASRDEHSLAYRQE